LFCQKLIFLDEGKIRIIALFNDSFMTILRVIFLI
jgi:hypothetical protein